MKNADEEPVKKTRWKVGRIPLSIKRTENSSPCQECNEDNSIEVFSLRKPRRKAAPTIYCLEFQESTDTDNEKE